MKARSKGRSSLDRAELVRRVRLQLMRRSAPRLQLSIIVALAGSAAFLTSLIGLELGIGSMLIRYPLAVVSGYLTFLILIRCWIAWQRMESVWGAPLDAATDVVLDVSTAKLPGSGSTALPFSGGASGGGGGGGTWAGALSPPRTAEVVPRSGGIGVDLDFDELWPLVLAAICALGGAIAIVYVIYAAPILLAEVALDAAVASTLYTRLRKQDASYWAVTVVRRTWLPALVILLSAAVGGYALDQVDPDARSIGAVFHAIMG